MDSVRRKLVLVTKGTMEEPYRQIQETILVVTMDLKGDKKHIRGLFSSFRVVGIAKDIAV